MCIVDDGTTIVNTRRVKVYANAPQVRFLIEYLRQRAQQGERFTPAEQVAVYIWGRHATRPRKWRVNLRKHIQLARLNLGDDARAPRYIRTVFDGHISLGYEWLGPLEECAA